jgi:hypothetical protein
LKAEQKIALESEPLRASRSSEWLPVCHGFRLEAGGKRLGIVEDVLYGHDRDPAALLVRGGLFGTRATIVAVEDVVEVIPSSKRVIVREVRAGEPPR